MTLDYDLPIMDSVKKYSGRKKFGLQIDNNVCLQVFTDIMNDFKGVLAEHKDGPILILDLSYRGLEELCAKYEPYIIYFDEIED